MKKESGESAGVVSQTDVKGLLQISEVKLESPTRTETVIALCDSACSHAWISETLAAELLVQGTATKLTLDGIFSQELVDTQMVQLKLIYVHSGDTDYSTKEVKPFVRKRLSVGNDFIDVNRLKQQYPHLELIPLRRTQLRKRRNITGSRHVPRDPTVGVLRNRPRRYSNCRPKSVRTGFRWRTTAIDLRIIF